MLCMNKSVPKREQLSSKLVLSPWKTFTEMFDLGIHSPCLGMQGNVVAPSFQETKRQQLFCMKLPSLQSLAKGWSFCCSPLPPTPKGNIKDKEALWELSSDQFLWTVARQCGKILSNMLCTLDEGNKSFEFISAEAKPYTSPVLSSCCSPEFYSQSLYRTFSLHFECISNLNKHLLLVRNGWEKSILLDQMHAVWFRCCISHLNR